jgi:Mg/Co/Ni transporter MgtE
MKSLVHQAAENDNISKLYMLNEDGTFYGAVDLKDLIIARKDTELEDLIVTSYPYVYATQSVESCIEELKDYSEDSIPVLDENGALVGVLTSDILADLTREDFEEDYARLAGLSGEEHVEEGISASVKARLPWLCVLFFLGFLVSGVVGFLATTAISPLVSYIENNGNMLFGLHLYPTQVTSLIAALLTVACIVYVSAFMTKGSNSRQRDAKSA